MRRLVPAIALLATIFTAVSAAAQDRAGAFDSYLLALSWTPAYCAADGDDRDDPRCQEGSGLGWGLHGLWPQHDDGNWPQYCPSARRDPSRAETAAQAALFGTSGAAWHQWNKHGRCTGLSAEDYYRLTAEALARVALPEVFAGVTRALRVDPEVVEAAFIEANPGLTPARMVTRCPNGELVEVRLCLTRALEPVDCAPALQRRECRLEAATLLPLR
ncbi:MAG: ribonuclease T2 family protein [Pararhodobacter sp.]